MDQSPLSVPRVGDQVTGEERLSPLAAVPEAEQPQEPANRSELEVSVAAVMLGVGLLCAVACAAVGWGVVAALGVAAAYLTVFGAMAVLRP